MAQKKRKDPFVVAARSFRPQRFEDVIGQEHVSKVLQNAIKSDRVAHAYLFCGPRGVGKTTTARILAKALNCLESDKPTPEPCQKCAACEAITRGTSVDVIEIDGASNRGIDEVRELRANARLQPAMGRFRIYYIDEVHMLTREAFNALLKILEEPPPHLRFIMSTTEEHKVPETIVSRCQTYRFRLMNTQNIVEHLRRVVESQRKAKVDDEVYYHIARAAAGSMRDGLSLLEQVLALKSGAITFEDAELVLGTVEYELLLELTRHLHDGNVADVLRIADEVARGGKDLAQFVRDLIDHYRNLLVVGSLEKPEESLMLSPDHIAQVREQAQNVAESEILRAVEILWEAESRMRYLADPRIVLEVALVKIARLGRTVEIESLLERLTALEEAIDRGGPSLVQSSLESEKDTGPKEEASLFGSARPPSSQPAPQPPSRPEPPPPLTPAEGNGLLERMEKEWDRIVSAVREKSPRVAGCLRGAKPVAVQGNTLVIGVPNENRYQHAALAKSDSAALLQSTVDQILGTRVKIRCEPRDFEVSEPGEEGKDEAAPPARKEAETIDLDKLKEEEPMLGPLLDVFDGRVIRVRSRAKPVKTQEEEEG